MPPAITNEGQHMRSTLQSTLRATLVGAACLTLGIWTASALAQAPPGAAPGRGPGAAAPRGGGGFSADPRAESRTYRLEGPDIDVPYCLYKSSKVSASKPAPLIVALHGMGAPPAIMCNKTTIDLAEEGGYIVVAPMGYSTMGWYGSPVINMGGPRAGGGGRGPGAGAPPGARPPGPGPGAPPGGGPGAGAGGAAAGPSNADIEKWSEADVMNVLAMMRKEFNVDPKRIYLTGHSMGGAGTLFLAAKHADLWAAAAPVAPASFMMTNNRADILKQIQAAGLPLMIVQGDADTVVPASNARLWVETAKEIGMGEGFKYVEQPGIDHGPVITTSQKDIFEFFARHAKK
jgi:poly(3-hydroxybutyrate) depolymerase